MWTEEDKQMAEEAIENSLNYLRHEESRSPYKVAQHKKTIRNEMKFLREEFPGSYILTDGYVQESELA